MTQALVLRGLSNKETSVSNHWDFVFVLFFFSCIDNLPTDLDGFLKKLFLNICIAVFATHIILLHKKKLA